jgi:hypothetical protein
MSNQAGIMSQSSKFGDLRPIRCETNRKARHAVHATMKTMLQAITLSPRSSDIPGAKAVGLIVGI